MNNVNTPNEYVVLGGTFDPVHNGHIETARQLARSLGYPQIVLMPCGDAYHKQGVQNAHHRLAMLQQAIQAYPELTLDARETRRRGNTYTVDTLQELRLWLGNNAHIVWIMGSDTAISLSSWHNWQHIFELSNVIVVSRAGAPAVDCEHWPATLVCDPLEFKRHSHGCYLQLALEPYALSSSQIRLAVKNRESVDNHVPPTVIDYIEQHGLYQG